MQIKKVLYRADCKATGGRDGRVVSSDGALYVKLATPRELGGADGVGSNPEQLLAAGYSVCFLSALRLVARRDGVALPEQPSVEGTVYFGVICNGFGLEVELRILLPGVSPEVANDLIQKADAICPYSNAIRGNINVLLVLA